MKFILQSLCYIVFIQEYLFAYNTKRLINEGKKTLNSGEHLLRQQKLYYKVTGLLHFIFIERKLILTLARHSDVAGAAIGTVILIYICLILSFSCHW